jgi:HEAT repeat protein
MTPRFRVALLGLVVLALATGALWLVLGTRGPRRGGGAVVPISRGGDDGDDAVPLRGPGGSTLAQPGGGRGPNLTGVNGGRTDAGGVRRTPTGIDLSDPRQVEAALKELLGEPEVSWKDVARLLAVHQGPLDDDVRQALLAHLRGGDRVGVRLAFASLHDGTVVRDLLALLDDPQAPAPARLSALEALHSMPGADPALVVRELESRLYDESLSRNERHAYLQAIGLRGGPEAARALVEYIQRDEAPSRIPAWLFQNMDLTKPESADVLVRALEETRSPEALALLARMAGSPGADSLAEPLIALSRRGVSDDVRREAVYALSRIGSAAAVDHLIAEAALPGRTGETALGALGEVRSADDEARAHLLSALEKASPGDHGQKMRQQLLMALGELQHEPALPHMVSALDDPSPVVRLAAVRAVGRMGARSQAHVPRLVNLYAAGDASVRSNVIIALGNVGGEGALNALLQIQGDESLSASDRATVRGAIASVRQRLEDPGDEASGPTLSGSKEAVQRDPQRQGR